MTLEEATMDKVRELARNSLRAKWPKAEKIRIWTQGNCVHAKYMIGPHHYRQRCFVHPDGTLTEWSQSTGNWVAGE